jgi:uncharacterized protein YcaQ
LSPAATLPLISAQSARRLLLGAQGLLDDPARPATAGEVGRLIVKLGFVQLDSINVVARAHDLILGSRLDGYRPDQLGRLLEQERFLFEHWTHDAAAIPTEFYPHWKPRFRRDRARFRTDAWWRKLVGGEAARLCAHVRRRIASEGPLSSADFEHPGRRGSWWGWKPQKAALEYLWRSGELAVHGRKNFQKRYDLPERVLPDHHALPEPEPDIHREWLLGGAAERLVIFTPRELAQFWALADAPTAARWCAAGARAGRLAPVLVEVPGAAPLAAFALADWEERLARLAQGPERVRLLAPFDPVIRDRARCRRLFGFDYTFEAFTPEAKRTYGYYSLPILEGDRLVGRLDPKLHRDRGLLEVRGLWWEPGVRPSQARALRLDQALARLAALAGARDVQAPSAPRRQGMARASSSAGVSRRPSMSARAASTRPKIPQSSTPRTSPRSR